MGEILYLESNKERELNDSEQSNLNQTFGSENDRTNCSSQALNMRALSYQFSIIAQKLRDRETERERQRDRDCVHK